MFPNLILHNCERHPRRREPQLTEHCQSLYVLLCTYIFQVSIQAWYVCVSPLLTVSRGRIRASKDTTQVNTVNPVRIQNTKQGQCRRSEQHRSERADVKFGNTEPGKRRTGACKEPTVPLVLAKLGKRAPVRLYDSIRST